MKSFQRKISLQKGLWKRAICSKNRIILNQLWKGLLGLRKHRLISQTQHTRWIPRKELFNAKRLISPPWLFLRKLNKIPRSTSGKTWTSRGWKGKLILRGHVAAQTHQNRKSHRSLGWVKLFIRGRTLEILMAPHHLWRINQKPHSRPWLKTWSSLEPKYSRRSLRVWRRRLRSSLIIAKMSNWPIGGSGSWSSRSWLPLRRQLPSLAKRREPLSHLIDLLQHSKGQ